MARARWNARLERVFGDPATIESRERAMVELIRRAEPASPASPLDWCWPVKGTLRSGFGERFGRMHYGIDIASPEGATIVAAEAGTVRLRTIFPDYGLTTVIGHGGSTTTLYAHQRDVVAAVGQRVRRGQAIGSVGATGRATGPHLHFEMREAGTPRDPSLLLPRWPTGSVSS